MARTDCSHGSEIRPYMAALIADCVATITGNFLAVEDAPAAADIAAGGEQRLQFTQTFDAGLLQLLEMRQ